MNHSAISSHIA